MKKYQIIKDNVNVYNIFNLSGLGTEEEPWEVKTVNDLEMIKNADISAVTADTPDDIKQYAKFIGGSRAQYDSSKL